MNIEQLSPRDKLIHFAANCAKEFNWSNARALDHIFATHPHLVEKAIAEDTRREKENPEEAFMEAVAREHERNPKEPRVRIYSRLLEHNAESASRYEAKVKGRSLNRLEAKRQFEADVIERAHDYMKAHPEATRFQAHRAVNREVQNAGQYQEAGEGPAEIDLQNVAGNSLQILGSMWNNFKARGDKPGGVRWAQTFRGGRLAEEAAELWALREGTKRRENLGIPGLSSIAEAQARQQVLRERPEINAMMIDGRNTTEAALDIMFPVKVAA